MSEIETVARAITATYVPAGIIDQPRYVGGPPHWEANLDAARAALAVMRKPAADPCPCEKLKLGALKLMNVLAFKGYVKVPGFPQKGFRP